MMSPTLYTASKKYFHIFSLILKINFYLLEIPIFLNNDDN